MKDHLNDIALFAQLNPKPEYTTNLFHRILFCVQLVFLFTVIFSNLTGQPKNGLVAAYPFNGNANDESGNNHHGIVNGAVLHADRFGRPGHAYSFDGQSYIQIPAEKLRNPTFTYTVWVNMKKVPGKGESCGVISVGDETGRMQSIGFTNEYNGKHEGWIACSFIMGTRWVAKFTSSQNAEKDTWYHLAIVRGKDFLKLYLDGKMIGEQHFQTSLPYYGDPTVMIIGMRSNYIQGITALLDDLNIYDRALEGSEIAALYNFERPKAVTSINNK